MNLLDLARSGLAEGTLVRESPTAVAGNSATRPWRVSCPICAAMDVLFTPAATWAEVADLYPGASFEPIPEPSKRTTTAAEADELRELVNVILADDSDPDRAEALAVAMTDPDAALRSFRALAAERG